MRGFRARGAVCTPDLTAVGYTYCLSAQRLLDVLNKGLDQGPAMGQTSIRVVVGRDFVPLTYAKIRLRTGDQRYMASTHVRKANVLFVAEISGGQPDVGGIRDLMKVTKKPVLTEVHVPPYHLVGHMHAEIWEQLADHLEGYDKFVPLTDVGVSPGVDRWSPDSISWPSTRTGWPISGSRLWRSGRRRGNGYG